MTLRVEISIIPFGDENKKKIIDVFNVSNKGYTGNGAAGMVDECEYVIERNKYKEVNENDLRIAHFRSEGHLKLVEKVIEAVQYD